MMYKIDFQRTSQSFVTTAAILQQVSREKNRDVSPVQSVGYNFFSKSTCNYPVKDNMSYCVVISYMAEPMLGLICKMLASLMLI